MKIKVLTKSHLSVSKLHYLSALVQSGTEHQTTDAAKSIDSDLRHVAQELVF